MLFDLGDSYDDNGIYMEVGFFFDIKDVCKKKLNFDFLKYLLEVDFVKLINYIFEGKKIKNKLINFYLY